MFIAVGGMHFKDLFEPAQATVRALFKTLDIAYDGELLFRGVDEKGAIAQHPGALKQAFEAGQLRAAEEHARRAMHLFTQSMREVLLCSGNVNERIQEQITAVEGLIAEVDALLAEIECELIHRALAQAKGNKAKAARLLQVDYKTMHTKLKVYGLGTRR